MRRPGATRMAARDAGAGTVLALAVITSVVLAATAVATFGEAVVVRHRAAAAADAAALAGAVATSSGRGDGCRVAGSVAARLGARLSACRLRGAVVAVRVDVSPPAWLAWAGTARISARAGPAVTNPVKRTRLATAS